jgi:hypothetical protein
MSMPELIEWGTFEEDFGPLTLHERIDAAVAILAHQQAVYHGTDAHTPVTEFQPRWQTEAQAEEEGPHIVDWLSAMARRT